MLRSGACRRRTIGKSDDEDDDPDDMDDDVLDEEEGDNEVDNHAASMSASMSGLAEASSMLDCLPSKEEDAIREVQRQRNLEQALFIQMEMQKKLHEQLEVTAQTLHKFKAWRQLSWHCSQAESNLPRLLYSNQFACLLAVCVLISIRLPFGHSAELLMPHLS